MADLYDTDVVAWAYQQAALLRARQWSALDFDNIAEEIEGVAKAEKRELGRRMSALFAQLLEWKLHPERRDSGLLRSIGDQRVSIARVLRKMPSLQSALIDIDWLDDAWKDALGIAGGTMELDGFPRRCPWTLVQVLAEHFLPD
ncbi:DUF29 domain-containing protein [Massilia sp. P8910]|uniref:DUF29 domain-containing protein n=1 Tax=Massilia antarctica TaxID=2765360 RepID=UPI001E3712CB|nr:DUF29 domain-containing protein [Massilia antarctica]MCE3608312.1 DUF29 domain-containing protein [Massilia antarctica]